MRVLIVAPFLYGSQVGTGGGTLCFNVLRRLAKTEEVGFIGFCSPSLSPVASHHVAELRALCSLVSLVPLKITWAKRILAKLCFVTKLEPFEASLRRSKRMERAITSAIAELRPDVVVFQFPWTAQFVTCAQETATVMDVQDAFSVSAFRACVAERNLLRRVHGFLRWIAWVIYERRHYRRFDRVIAITEQDRNGLTLFSPGLNVAVSPAAIDIPELKANAYIAGCTVVFFGSFSHQPNVDAIRFFVREIWPDVASARPDVTFLVAGRAPPEDLVALQTERVRFVGFVPDLLAFLRDAAVVVVPLRFGGGIKIKVLEAMAAGSAIVSTSVGTEETGVENGVHALVRDDPAAFAAAVVELLACPTLARELANRARQLVRERFSWEAKMSQLMATLRAAAATGSPSKACPRNAS